MVDYRDFDYVPVIEVRRSEMSAMEELVPADKESMLPFLTLRPWLTAHHFESVLAKVKAAIGHRPVWIDVTSDRFNGDIRRPVHDALDDLRDSANGYSKYYEFVEEHESFIPTLQIGNANEIGSQIEKIEGLGRGVSLKLTEQAFRFGVPIAGELARLRDQSSVHILIDFAQQSRELLNRAANAVTIIEDMRNILPDAYFSVSASTFPASFTSTVTQPIFERQFYDLVVDQVGAANLIYSDHASVRVERQLGGGGAPAPRIDTALPMDWNFFREEAGEDMDRYEAFQTAAQRAVESEGWTDLGIWGTSEILKTANGNGTINSAQRSTAVRINIHLHQQANFGLGIRPDDETEWSD